MTREPQLWERPARLGVGNPARLTPLDLATARMLGEDRREPLPRVGRDASLRDALFDVIGPALECEKCLVAFSGGRESSWLLAAATVAARLRGHRDPIPVTLRFPESASSRAMDLQERVIAHLGLDDWERVEIDDEFEMLGPYARRALTGAGVLFPANAYVFLPLLDRARGGWLLAGGGLTDFFLYWRWSGVADVLARRRRPRRRDVTNIAQALMPRVRAARSTSRRAETMPWLQENAARQFDAMAKRRAEDAPLGFDAALRRQRTHRCQLGTGRSLDALAAFAGARITLPFREDRYLAAVAAGGGPRGWGDRSATLRRLVGDLLPEELFRRSDGRHQRRPHFGAPSRAFGERWSGEGLDKNIVDTDKLRATWASGVFPWQATVLFQLAFAHDEWNATPGYELSTNHVDGGPSDLKNSAR